MKGLSELSLVPQYVPYVQVQRCMQLKSKIIKEFRLLENRINCSRRRRIRSHGRCDQWDHSVVTPVATPLLRDVIDTSSPGRCPDCCLG